MAYIIMIPMVAFGPVLIKWIYGSAYLPARSILMIHVLSLILAFLQIGRHHYLLAEGKHRFILISVMTGAVLNIILNLVLIPVYGGNGAAIATVVAQLAGVVLINFFNKGTLGLGATLIRGIVAPWTLLAARKPVA